MRLPWLETRVQTRRESVALLPLAAAGLVYGAAARLHRRAYLSGWRRRRRFAGHVISVGSLVVGGAGKTPAAAWLAARLRARGWKVVLVSRGWGREDDAQPVRVVSDGRYVRSRVEQAGDEPLLLAAHAPGVPVLVGRDRARVGLHALSLFGAELLVLDDGFQHHRLARDVDLLVLDGAFGFGNRRVLPRGPLREPMAALRFADALGVVDAPLSPEDDALVRRWRPDAFRFAARRRPVVLRSLRGDDSVAPGWLSGRSVGLMAGLARPAQLRRTVELLGAEVLAERWFPDHHAYRKGDVTGLEREAPVWVTTEKDAVKIPATWLGGADVRVLRVEFEVVDGSGLLDWIESRLH